MDSVLQCDVLVTGGGVAGIAAAVAAGRMGAKTALMEASQMLGGTACAGLGCSLEGVDVELMGGLNREIVERLMDRKAVIVGAYAPFSIADFQDVCLDMLREAKADIFFGCAAQEAVWDCERLRGIKFRFKNQILEARAGAYVDGTGDGEVCRMAGAGYELGDPVTGETQPVSALFRMGNVDIERVIDYVLATPEQFYKEKLLFECDPGRTPPLLIANGFFDWVKTQKKRGLNLGREAFAVINTPNPGEVLINGTRLAGVDALDVFESSRAILELRAQVRSLAEALKNHMPGFEDSYVIDVAPSLGVRETRRVEGLYQLTIKDIREGRDFPDSIAYNFFPADIHGPLSNPLGYDWILPGGKGVYGIPLRCLIPRDVHGVFVAGRCISAGHMAHGSTRTMPCCIATGQAAGTAAALYREGETTEQLTGLVREALRRQNVTL